jgi:hypothetical protein
VFNTAPTPVIRAHPNSAAVVNGILESMGTQEAEETTVYSENAETPR